MPNPEASPPLGDRAYPVWRTWMGTCACHREEWTAPTRHGHHALRNRSLRDAAYHWGRTAVQNDPATRAYSQSLRQRGDSHARALRSVTDRCLRMLVGLLDPGRLFDPKHVQR
jgi:hypothetical protein